MYQPDEEVRLEVRMEDETVWLTQAQMVELFNSSKQNISLHISNIYKEGELSQDSTHSKKIDFFVRTSLPPVEGIFFNGQIFDAYKFATDYRSQCSSTGGVGARS